MVIPPPLLWRHNGRDGLSNYQPDDCILNLHPGADQRKHQSSASVAFLQGIPRCPVNSPHKWPLTLKMFPFDDVIMQQLRIYGSMHWIRIREPGSASTLHRIAILIPIFIIYSVLKTRFSRISVENTFHYCGGRIPVFVCEVNANSLR